VFGRTPGQVLNIVYLTPKVANPAGRRPNLTGGSARMHNEANLLR
jgi:hypothetical protein